METFTLDRLLSGLRRQWWIVLQAVVIVAAGTAFFTMRGPERPYEATTSFLVQPELDGRTATNFTTINGQVRLLLSDTVIDGAAEEVGISAGRLRRMVSASADPTSRVITVLAEDDDPALAIAVADALVEGFVADREAARSSSLTARRELIDSQLLEVGDLIDTLDAQITAEGITASTDPLVAQRNGLLAQYQTLFEQQQQVLTQLATQPEFIERLDLATAKQQDAPSLVLRVAAGAFLGLLVGATVGVLREVLDRRLRTAEQIADVAGLPVLAGMPTIKSPQAGGLAMATDPAGPYAEAARSLQTTIRFMETDDQRYDVIAVSSPTGGDGKTTLAANLAASFALSGYSVVVVSADLRRATLDERLGAVPGAPGLSDLLQARRSGPDAPGADLVPVLSDTEITGLRLLGAGSGTTQPAELLGSPQFQALVDELRALVDVVILDCPPALVADALLLSRVSDATILVAGVGRTTRPSLEDAVERFRAARAPLLGVVANRSGSAGRYGYYGYRSTYTAQPAPNTAG